eukprot:Gb_06591 [translate_table: standard]
MKTVSTILVQVISIQMLRRKRRRLGLEEEEEVTSLRSIYLKELQFQWNNLGLNESKEAPEMSLGEWNDSAKFSTAQVNRMVVHKGSIRETLGPNILFLEDFIEGKMEDLEKAFKLVIKKGQWKERAKGLLTDTMDWHVILAMMFCHNDEFDHNEKQTSKEKLPRLKGKRMEVSNSPRMAPGGDA